MAEIAIIGLTGIWRLSPYTDLMNLKTWRQREQLTLKAASDRLGLAGARTYQRYECGETRASALLVEHIREITGGAVTPSDMHDVRLAWERTAMEAQK